ncbi:MAG: sigma-70 family RNA polymerase sigma factor [Bacteroidetes bacterium]|nr:sigma-70 family RNA polymerase sigma factor [Bacteroidota bacterium]
MITTTQEYSLIDRVIAGEEAQYAVLVDKYKSYAFTIALKVVGNRAEAEEIAQDGFIKAFHYLKKFNREAKFSTWLYRIVFNTAISYKRKNKIQFQSIENHIEYAGKSDDEIEKEEKKKFVTKAIEKLTEADRVAVQLYYIKEFSLEETAEMLGQNINTLKVRVHRARQRLADELKKILKEEALTL